VFTTEAIPGWFRSTPLYSAWLAKERTTTEATRSALAAERATIRAVEAKEGPKRQRIADAARLQSDAARLKAADALAALHRVEAESAAPALAASHRLSVIDTGLARLAHPCVATALDALLDAFEDTRRHQAAGAADRLAAIRTARGELQALALTAGVDTVAAAEAIMARLDMPAV